MQFLLNIILINIINILLRGIFYIICGLILTFFIIFLVYIIKGKEHYYLALLDDYGLATFAFSFLCIIIISLNI